MARDILVAAISSQDDMVIVEGEQRTGAIDGARGTQSDVVVMNEEESMCDAVLGANGPRGVIAVCRDGRVAVLCKLMPDRTVVREISAMTLVESIRELAC
jgi:hypothetical protein